MSTVLLPQVLEPIFGQDSARAVLAGSVHAPVHAYLFVGPPGCGKQSAALRFAAALTCPYGGCGTCPSCLAVLAHQHPDVVTFDRSGAGYSTGELREVVTTAQRTPRLAVRQVLILNEFHLAARFSSVVLKTIEEPPSSTLFLVLADSTPRGLETIVSRCVRVEFGALSTTSIESKLLEEGVDVSIANSAAAAAGGRIDRARLLASDPSFVARSAFWRSIPERLDGTGATISKLSTELLAMTEELGEVLRSRQEEEIDRAAEIARNLGERRIPGRQLIEDRHKRELRRLRTDELRAGLAALGEVYRLRLDSPGLPASRIAALARACDLIDDAARSLLRNPSELLLLEALLLALDSTN